jgi:hypothetical protein
MLSAVSFFICSSVVILVAAAPMKLSGQQQNTVESHEKVIETGQKLFTKNMYMSALGGPLFSVDELLQPSRVWLHQTLQVLDVGPWTGIPCCFWQYQNPP